jgi:Tfp pilus assembly protein FimT
MKNQSGYTLFELITLLSIIAIFLVILFGITKCSQAITSGELAREAGYQVKQFNKARK